VRQSTATQMSAVVWCTGMSLEILRPRERRHPQMPNVIPVLVEHRIVALARGAPGSGPARIAAELAREKHGGLRVSANGVNRVLRRQGIGTRALRNGLLAGYASPPEPVREPEPERHISVEHPGELVQMDCFCIGRLARTRGDVWPHAAIDAASAFTWAELHVTPRSPDVRFASRLARRVATELRDAGWEFERVSTDNGSEFRNHVFDAELARLSDRHTLISPGRPQSNGFVERVQRSILEECWKPSFARYLVPKYMGLRRELVHCLEIYNYDRVSTRVKNYRRWLEMEGALQGSSTRAHNGRLARGRTPVEVLGAAWMFR
jgi:transposase InsO family protein